MCVVNIKQLSDPYGQISNTPGVANALALGHGLGPGWLWVRCPRLAPGDQGRRWEHTWVGALLAVLCWKNMYPPLLAIRPEWKHPAPLSSADSNALGTCGGNPASRSLVLSRVVLSGQKHPRGCVYDNLSQLCGADHREGGGLAPRGGDHREGGGQPTQRQP